MRLRLAAIALGLCLVPFGARATPRKPRATPRPPARAGDWTRVQNGACPALPGLDGPGLCTVGAAPLKIGPPNARAAAIQKAEHELARLVQWRVDRIKDPNAPKPTSVSLSLEGVRTMQTRERRGQLYILLRLDEPQVQAIVDRAK